jgi:hypothetical protein
MTSSPVFYFFYHSSDAKKYHLLLYPLFSFFKWRENILLRKIPWHQYLLPSFLRSFEWRTQKTAFSIFKKTDSNVKQLLPYFQFRYAKQHFSILNGQ